MSTDPNTIPSGLLESLSVGLEQESGSVFENIFTHRRDVTDLSGKAPLLDSQDLVRRDENRNLSDTGEAKPYDREMSSVPYDTSRQVGAEIVSDANVMSFDSFNEDAIARGINGAKKQADLNVDLNVEAVLINGSNWQTQSASAAYSNHSSAEPFTDLDNAFDKCPGANVLVLGRTVFTELSQLPDITARLSNFDAGGAGESELENLLLNKYGARGLEEVHIVRKWYNGENEGQGLSKNFVMDEEMFLGHKDALQIIDPQHDRNPQVDQERKASRSATEIYVTRWTDEIAMSSDKGVLFTGI